LANKQYISVIRLLDHCGISTGDEFNVSRAKKQLQAEFGIAPGGFIEVDGYSYSRHDVLDELERPDFSERLVFHRQLWNSPQILQWLETNTVNLATVQEEFKPFWGNNEFDEFFSPFFAGPFSVLSRTLIAEMRLQELGDLLNYEGFLLPAEREEVFRPLRIFFEENIRTLRNVNAENYKMMRPKIAHWIDSDWYLFFNNLPHEFYDDRNDITNYLVNIGVAVQKSHRSDCQQISKQLISLQDTPENLRGVIVSNHAVYMGSSGTIGWRGIFWVIWIVFMLMRAGSCSAGCNGETKPTFRQYSFPEEKIKYQIPDSIYKIIKEAGINIKRDSFVK
jgi:hypothetical protein